MASPPSNLGKLSILPPELLLIAISFLNVPSISDLRLTCKTLATLGTGPLFRDLHIMFHRKSFQNLLNVSQHPVLRNHVHTILYEFRFLADVDRVEYEYNIQNHESFENHGPEEKTLLLEEGWKTYNKLLVEQDYMRTTQRDIVTFTQALPRFTMLKRLEMRTVHGMRDVYGLPHSASMVEAYAATLADEGMMLSTGEFDSQELGFRALTALLLGATGMKEKLESLVVSNVHWSFFGETPAGMNYYRSVFAGLKDVHLALVSDYDDQEEEDIVVLRHKELGLALSAATALESLRLDLGGDGDLEPTTAVMLRRMQVPIMLENIVQDKIWEKLRIIELCFVTSTVRCLLEFIRRHSSTLKSVKWSNMWLTECTEGSGWFQIFTALRDACLDVVEFRGTWGCEGQVEGHQRRPKLLNMAERGKEIRDKILMKPVRLLRKSLSDSELQVKVTPLYNSKEKVEVVEDPDYDF